MQATFHIKRERIQHFHMERYQRLGGSFHFHSHIELLLLHRGEAEVCINEARIPLHENELAMVAGYEAHKFLSLTDNVDCTILFIPAFLCPDFVEALRNKTSRFPVVRDAAAMARITGAVTELSREGLNAIEQNGYIHVILGTVLGQIGLEERVAPPETELPDRLLFYINEHYKEDISAESIAQAMGYSRNHLSRSFRASLHVGLGRYINTVRLKNAVMLMRENKGSITDCALESGFPSLRTFYRVFAEEFGCSPREYLKRECF